MDETGHLIVHPDYDTWSLQKCSDPKYAEDGALPEPAFVGQKEPELAQLMLDQGLLRKHAIQDSVSGMEIVSYRVQKGNFPPHEVALSGKVSGKTSAEYHLTAMAQTNMVLIILDDYYQASQNFQCGVLSSRCPNVVLPRFDPYQVSANQVCDPPLEYYQHSYSSLYLGGDGIAVTELGSVTTVQPAGQCDIVDTSIDSDTIMLAGFVLLGLAVALFAASRCLAMVRSEQKMAGAAL